MVMDWQNIALATAGVLGSTVAVIHGVLTQRLMVQPFQRLALADGRIGAPILRLVPLLLHMSTVVWFVGGLALVAAAIWFGRDFKLATGVAVGGLYLFGALGNLWGTRGRHPGWMLLAVALALIAYGLAGPL